MNETGSGSEKKTKLNVKKLKAAARHFTGQLLTLKIY